MSIKIERNDITKIRCDAIVNATDFWLSGSGGVDAAVHRAAGSRLDRACARIGTCAPGQAVITRGYALPARYVIHTVGPVWQDGRQGEAGILASCYRNALHLAVDHRCRSIAVPLISSGTFGFPKDLALNVAENAIRQFLDASEALRRDIQVTLVVYDPESFRASKALFQDVAAYIDENYLDLFQAASAAPSFNAGVPDANAPSEAEPRAAFETEWQEIEFGAGAKGHGPTQTPLFDAMPQMSAGAAPSQMPAAGMSLEEKLQHLDESFSQSLLRLIEERGMTDAQCYKRANIDRRLFSKIRSHPDYRPSKQTVVAFCISLELTLSETEALLAKAGYALSNSSKFDVIIRYFIERHDYDIFNINETLFAFDQVLLG